MTQERLYGVECKNAACHAGIVLGSYLTRPQNSGDLIEFVVVKKAGRVTCPNCHREYEYDRPDIREFAQGP